MGLKLMIALLAGAATDDPDYPLGRLRLPPIADEAAPFRLVDLRYAFSDDGTTLSSFETRLRVGGSLFVGGEVRGERRGVFVDTQRLELGVSEEEGDYEVEASMRAPRFLLRARGLREDEEWALASEASFRLSSDLEILLRHRQDFAGDWRPGENRALSAGVLYQRENHFEALVEARIARIRTEGLFENDVETYRAATVWNRAPVEIDAEISYAETSGRLARNELSAAVGADTELGSYLLARVSTLQRWEPGVLRFEDEYRLGLTFFGRRHRFPRRSEAASRLLALQRWANELGYNERRVYGVDDLRRFRERLGISAARRELSRALDELYRAQVRERNVPQIGFELSLADDALLGIERRTYRAHLGIPWRVSFPWSRDEDSVDFVTADFTIEEEDFIGGIRAVSRAASITVFLNREMSLAFRWERPGRTPDEIARRESSPTRFTVSYEYALGR